MEASIPASHTMLSIRRTSRRGNESVSTIAPEHFYVTYTYIGYDAGPSGLDLVFEKVNGRIVFHYLPAVKALCRLSTLDITCYHYDGSIPFQDRFLKYVNISWCGGHNSWYVLWSFRFHYAILV
jgi:hypothetical protein